MGFYFLNKYNLKKNLNELLFKEVKGLGCGHGALSVAVQD